MCHMSVLLTWKDLKFSRMGEMSMLDIRKMRNKIQSRELFIDSEGLNVSSFSSINLIFHRQPMKMMPTGVQL